MDWQSFGGYPKNIYRDNIPKNIDRVDDHNFSNGRERYDSPMTENNKPWVSYDNVVQGLMRKQIFCLKKLGKKQDTLVAEPLQLRTFIYGYCYGEGIHNELAVLCTVCLTSKGCIDSEEG